MRRACFVIIENEQENKKQRSVTYCGKSQEDFKRRLQTASEPKYLPHLSALGLDRVTAKYFDVSPKKCVAL